MGIPGLTVRLTQYAIPLQIVKQPRNSNIRTTYRLVIDGPALAHHMYFRCRLQRKRTARCAFDAYPTYTEVSREILRWLDRVETVGLMVHRIYFDGYLPANKREERSKRLNKNFRELRNYRSSHQRPQGACLPRKVITPEDPDDFTMEKGSDSLPALPFLVSTIIETLRASRYATRTQLVPGEADTYCAGDALHDDRLIVLTGDSDLLVHCVSGSVTFLDDITVHSALIKTRIFTPTRIAEQLHCDDFRSIAYQMAKAPRLSPVLAAQIVRTDPVKAKDQANAWYNKTLQLDNNEEASFSIDRHPVLQSVLATADPRISELLCAWTVLLQEYQHSGDEAGLRMSLPVLIDDPTRASAWRASAHIRSIAYSLLQINERPFPVAEMDRRGGEIRECQCLLLRPESALEQSQQLISEFFIAGEAYISRPFWKRRAVMHLLRRLGSGSEIFPSRERLLALLPDTRSVSEISSKPTILSWEVVHFKAQVEGVLYSLHMLKTILIMKFELDDQAHTLQDGASQSPKSMLDDLPALQDMMTSPNEHLVQGEEAELTRRYIDDFFDGIQAESHHGVVERKAKKSKGKRKRDSSNGSAKSASAKQQGPSNPNNLYTFLNEA